MEKHTCKLCFRRFSNGRALGGHMRSHVSAAAATTKEAPPAPHPAALMLLEDHHQQEPSLYSPSSSSSSGPEEAVALALEKGGPSSGGGGVSYVLRENPRKSYRVVDPEFSSVADYTFFFGASGGNGNSSSVVVQDRESETESSRAPSSSRRRSKRRRRYSPVPPLLPPKSEDNSSKHPTVAEAEPVSSVSDTTPDDDVALCLMMLSRDVWTWKDQHRNRGKQEEKKREEEEEEEERIYVAEKEEEDHHQSESEEEEERRMTTGAGSRSRKGGRSRYQCGTCRKVFRSYQALGGHRASHKKAKPCAVVAPLPPLAPASGNDNDSHHQQHQIHDGEFEANGGDPRVHECPFCFRVFSSGQALGGHKRSHFVSAAPSPRRSNAVTTAIATNTFAAAVSSYSPATAAAGNDSGAAKLGKSFIDLNLPAPVEFEDGSHVELSDVSDGKE